MLAYFWYKYLEKIEAEEWEYATLIVPMLDDLFAIFSIIALIMVAFDIKIGY